MPSNEGRGYVLRRIIRRAVRHGYKLGAQDIFFYKLVGALAEQMGEAYPELVDQLPVIEKVLRVEEEQFSKTLERGMNILAQTLTELDGTVIPGDVVFKLYDTYGFPADLTADVAREQNYTIDEAGFTYAMQAQRARAQQASNFGTDYNETLKITHNTEFTGYDKTQDQANVVEIIVDNQTVETIEAGQQGIIILDNTAFYAESGGQAGDCGSLLSNDTNVFTVTDTKKIANAFGHQGIAKAAISKGQSLLTVVDITRRDAIKLNHSATHLLHAALRQLLGDHVSQKGSLVDDDKLRFDFAHFEAITAEQLNTIEQLVNAQIRANHQLNTQLMDLDEAKASGAMALFGEKYDEKVRVVSMGEFSTELCGGTHVNQTGDIGLFKLTSESGIASGVRRIEAITGATAVAYLQQQAQTLQQAANLLKVDPFNVVERITNVQDLLKVTEKSLTQAKQKLASQQGSDLVNKIQVIKGQNVLVANLPGVEAKALRGMLDELKQKISSGIIVLGVPGEGKVNLIAGVTSDLVNQIKAGELINFVASQVGGKGGGRPDMAQAGGTQPENLEHALTSVYDFISEKI
jgi:alanyl-tRNA synthetase